MATVKRRNESQLLSSFKQKYIKKIEEKKLFVQLQKRVIYVGPAGLERLLPEANQTWWFNKALIKILQAY